MSMVSPTDWHAVARGKLIRVLGEQEGGAIFDAVLLALELPAIRTPHELQTFADHLARRNGFAAAIASMLRAHAAIHWTGPR